MKNTRTRRTKAQRQAWWASLSPVTDDLVEFLRGRLDEDEAVAQAAAVLWDDGNWTEVEADPYAHAQRHDPARVLREVAAKRAILDAHGWHTGHHHGNDGPRRCLVCITDQEDYADMWLSDLWPCLTVRHLAAVYSGHPDYRTQWKP